MERERLNQLMQDPSAVQRQDIADLKAMTERYPWFSGAHLLLAVGDHAAGDVFFDEQLRTTAAHLPSRAVLFDLVHTETEEAAPARMSVVPPTPLPPPPIVPTAPEIPAPAVAEKVEAPVPAPEPLPEVERPAPVVFTPPVVVQKPPVIEQKVEEVILEVVQPVFAEEEEEEEEEQVPEIDVVDPVEEEEVQAIPEEDPLDKQIRNAALAGGYALVLEHTPLPPPTVPETVPVAATPIPPEPASKPAPARRDRMRFTDWLQVPEEVPAEAAPVAPPVLPSVPTTVAMDPAPLRSRFAEGFAEAQRAQGDMVPAAVPSAPSDTKSLIERFIQQSVQAAPAKKAEFYTPQLAAKRSLEDHSDLVSETLAKVYEAQGNYSKALAAYRRLALKHPDKSTYFAALSKALEAKMSK